MWCNPASFALLTHPFVMTTAPLNEWRIFLGSYSTIHSFPRHSLMLSLSLFSPLTLCCASPLLAENSPAFRRLGGPHKWDIIGITTPPRFLSQVTLWLPYAPWFTYSLCISPSLSKLLTCSSFLKRNHFEHQFVSITPKDASDQLEFA